MPVGATIGAIGALGAAGIGAYSANRASTAQQQTGREALAQQLRMFGIAQGQLQPFINAGASALPTLQNWLTSGNPNAALSAWEGLVNPGTAANQLAQMPGYQFQRQQGEMAATNALAVRGLGGSTGPIARAISEFNQGLAGTTWQSATNALRDYWTTRVNPLQGFAGMGAQGAGALTGAAINTGGQAGTTLTNIGNAQASGILGSANAISGGLQGAAGSATNALLLSRLLPGMGNPGGGGLYSYGAGGYTGQGPFLP